MTQRGRSSRFRTAAIRAAYRSRTRSESETTISTGPFSSRIAMRQSLRFPSGILPLERWSRARIASLRASSKSAKHAFIVGGFAVAIPVVEVVLRHDTHLSGLRLRLLLLDIERVIAIGQPLVFLRDVSPSLGIRTVQEQSLLATELRITPVAVFVGHVADLG